MVTGYDVAAQAGVSQSTVSRALRNDPRISAATRGRVREAAERLGFVASQHGRQLATRRTLRIGVLATELDNPFYMTLLGPLHEYLRDRGYSTVLLTDAPHTPMNINELVDGSFDGLVLANCRVGSQLPRALTERGLPAVTLNREVEPASIDSCAVANADGGALVARAILAHGHRRIAHIAGPHNTSTGRDRAAGFRRELNAAGVRLDTSLLRRGEFVLKTGHDAMVELCIRPDRPTAVFCANDVIAVGACNAARELGLLVPDDVSIVGFDNLPLAAWDVLRLTTVDCELAAMARTAGELLLSRLEDPDQPTRRVVLQPTFARRATLAPPAT